MNNMSRFRVFSRNVNTTNLKTFTNYGGIHRFDRKLSKYSGKK